LTPQQRAQLPALLARGAEAFGSRGELWTTKRVAAVIAHAFGVRLEQLPGYAPDLNPDEGIWNYLNVRALLPRMAFHRSSNE